MSLARYLTPSRLRDYIECPHRFRLRYRDRLVPPEDEPALPLVVGALLHRALALYHVNEPQTVTDVLACVDQVVADAPEKNGVDGDQFSQARADVAGYLLDYHASPSDVHGERRTEVALKGRAGPLTLATVADLVWWDRGVVTVDEFKLSMPAHDVLLLQTVMIRVGLRQSLVPEGSIRQRVVAFRPSLVVRDVALDEGTYRNVLRLIFATANEMARDRTWDPRPGVACANCDYGVVCAHAAQALEAVPF